MSWLLYDAMQMVCRNPFLAIVCSDKKGNFVSMWGNYLCVFIQTLCYIYSTIYSTQY